MMNQGCLSFFACPPFSRSIVHLVDSLWAGRQGTKAFALCNHRTLSAPTSADSDAHGKDANAPGRVHYIIGTCPSGVAMSSNSQSALPAKASNTSKTAGLSNQSSPAHSQTNTFFATEGLNQRRSGGSSSLGSASTSKSLSTPRNIQSAKAKHKQSKRFRLADEDALAESVSIASSSRISYRLAHFCHRTPCTPPLVARVRPLSPTF